MRNILILALLGCALVLGTGNRRMQTFSLNIPGAPYPCVHPDRRVTFRVAAPDAQKVQVRLGGAHDMTQGADGLWMVTIPPQVVGLPLLQHRGGWRGRGRPGHAHLLRLGMGQQRHRNSRAGGRCGLLLRQRCAARPGEPALVLLQGHGQVAPLLRLHAAGIRRQCAHPLSGSVPASRLGRKRAGLASRRDTWISSWTTCIAEKKAKPMLIVMDNLNAVKPGEDASLYCGARASLPDARWRMLRRQAPGRTRRGSSGFPSNWGRTFTEMMFTDLIPMVERTYRVAARPRESCHGGALDGRHAVVS